MKKALRPEKDCLNCGARVEERYCPVCGQENIPARESFGHLVTHFVFDLFHFDGKFFETLKYLLFKPGYLSQEHLKGRRAGYLHPIRLYVFTSAFFFLVFFNFYNQDEVITPQEKKLPTVKEWMQQYQVNKKALIKARSIAEGFGQKTVVDSLNKQLDIFRRDSLLVRKDSAKAFKDPKILRRDGGEFSLSLGTDGKRYSSEASYDSAQARLPASKRRNWLMSILDKKDIQINQKYKGDNDAIMKAVVNKFVHLLPQTFFTSLPLFALLLQLLYVRRRQQFYYVDHLVYSIHVFCATFIMTLLSMWLGTLLSYLPGDLEDYIGPVLFFLVMLYGYKAQRHFYGQTRTKTFLKFFSLLFLFFWVMIFVFVLFFLGSALTI